MPIKQPKCKESVNITIPSAIIYTVLIAIIGFSFTLNTRVAVLETQNDTTSETLTVMAAKIDKIYDKVTFGSKI